MRRVPDFFAKPAEHQMDWMTREGAEALAGIIRDRWRECGHEVAVEVEPVPVVSRVSTGQAWQVRTHLVGGLPVQRKCTEAT